MNVDNKAGLFIVGAPKAGTSTLYHFLNSHPDVVMSEIKEPNYFSRAETELLYSSKQYDELFTSIPSEEDYRKLFKGSGLIFGEASVSYLFYEKVPARIKKYNEKAKIVICLRNPVDRAFSHYQMEERLGLTEKTMSECLSNPDSVEYRQYIDVSMYTKQVNRYFEVFGRNNVLIVWFEEIRESPNQVCEKLCEFLSIDLHQSNLGHRNSVKYSKYPIVMRLYKSAKLRRIFKMLLPSVLIDLIKNQFFKDKSSAKLSLEDQRHLSSIFRGEILHLEQLLSVNLDHWK